MKTESAMNIRTDIRPEASMIAALYRASPLYRPVGDVGRIALMYEGSNVVLTAWEENRLVGILRGWTDGVYDGYICDLAVHPEAQNSGVGKALLERALAMDARIQWVLRASEIAANYYAHLGWEKIENGWCWRRWA